MFDGDGAEQLELQAYKIAENATLYRGSHACPTCGVIMDPVQFMYGKGMCASCYDDRLKRRAKGKMVS